METRLAFRKTEKSQRPKFRAMFSPITKLCALLIVTRAVLAASESTAVYDVLKSYDFPVGILPKGVTGYELDSSSGKFAVYFNQACSFTIDGYDLKYKSKITGTIARDEIRNLKGIQVKLLFLWVNIVEVSKNSNKLEFSVGIASASFPLDSFYESPQCGCGFHCGINGGEKGGKFISDQRLVSYS